MRLQVASGPWCEAETVNLHHCVCLSGVTFQTKPRHIYTHPVPVEFFSVHAAEWSRRDAERRRRTAALLQHRQLGQLFIIFINFINIITADEAHSWRPRSSSSAHSHGRVLACEGQRASGRFHHVQVRGGEAQSSHFHSEQKLTQILAHLERTPGGKQAWFMPYLFIYVLIYLSAVLRWCNILA